MGGGGEKETQPTLGGGPEREAGFPQLESELQCVQGAAQRPPALVWKETSVPFTPSYCQMKAPSPSPSPSGLSSLSGHWGLEI